MNNHNFWIAVSGGAALSLLVSNLPLLDMVNCLLFAGFWGSAIFAVWLYRRQNGSLTMREALKIGVVSGLAAGVVGFLLSFGGLAGIQGFMNRASLILPPETFDEMKSIPAWMGIVFNLVGVLIEVVCGFIGGWIGGSIFRSDRLAGKAGAQA